MKKLIIIFGVIVSWLPLSAQESLSYDEIFSASNSVELKDDADYGYYLSGPPYFCSIDFWEKEKVYVIGYSVRVAYDMSEGSVVSSGFFKRRGKNVYLHDTATGLKMKAVIKSGKLTFVEGYGFLKNKQFTLTDQWLYAYVGHGVITNYNTIEKARDALFKFSWPDVTPGDYTDGWMELHLADDGTFACGCKYDLVRDMKLHTLTVPILEGTWSQKGNLIILHDEHTDHDYYLICEEDGLRPMLLPGFWNLSVPCRDMDGILFKSL